jgi:Ca2+-dependent lipid-binding protein
MVALNYQSIDDSMCLEHAFFSDNGGCGYLLKPLFLLDNQPYNPKGKGKRLQIHVISGQHLPKEKNSIQHTDIVDPYVEISVFGIKSDYDKTRTPSVRNNGLNPIWDCKITLDIECPDLCLILFEVRDEDRYGRSTFLGQSCLPFNTLQLGYRHIKLKEKHGEYIHGTLFVHIKIDDL